MTSEFYPQQNNRITDSLSDQIEVSEKQRVLIANAIDEIAEGICICDENGIVRVWNTEIENIYNISREDIIGRPLTDFFPDAADMRVLKTRERIINRKHTPRPGTDIIISAAPVYNGTELIGSVSTDRRLQDVIDLSKKLREANHFIKLLEKRIDSEGSKSTEFFMGTNKKVLEQVEIAITAAKTDVPILLQGETGTGKEVFSRFIHKKSGVKGEFVAVNCSAIPEELFESEFFGYEPGSFTGASSQGKSGYLEQANGGTLFLDEISELPLPQQTKLLRALQEQSVRRVGGNREIPINTRIITATNLDLDELVKEKKFRIDLYYRLKGILLQLPPLRERKDDMDTIVKHFLHMISNTYGMETEYISADALHALREYSWPGNVRELKNVLRQMVVMSTSKRLTADDLPAEIRCDVFGECELVDRSDTMTLQEQVDNYEKDMIDMTLRQTAGNVAAAAEILRTPRTTLQYKIKKYGI